MCLDLDRRYQEEEELEQLLCQYLAEPQPAMVEECVCINRQCAKGEACAFLNQFSPHPVYKKMSV